MILQEIINLNTKLSNYFNCNIYDLFLNDYCLEYFNILNKIYPDGKMVLEKNKEHCAILIDNIIYDVTGVRNDSYFVVANDSDIDFVNEFYMVFDKDIRDDLYLNLFGCVKKIKK